MVSIFLLNQSQFKLLANIALTIAFVYSLFSFPQAALCKGKDPVTTASTLFDKKQFEKASDVLTNYLKLCTNDKRALFLRSQCYEALALDKLAIKDLTTLIDMNSKVVKYRLRRGERWLDVGEADKAISDLIFVKNNAPPSSHVWDRLAIAYRIAKKPKKAIECYTQKIKLEPRNAKAYKLRGRLYQLNGDYKKAISDFSKSISIQDGKTDLYVQRGYCYFALNQIIKAKSDFSKAIELGHKSVDPLLMRAKVYDKLGQKKLAAKDRKAARVDDYEIKFER